MKKRLLFYSLAVLAVIIEWLVYSMIAAALDLKGPGGYIPVAVFVAIAIMTYRYITKFAKPKIDDSQDNE